ncbi:hypothetical protein BDR05DRAFT_1003322 [Suillus weaverae]|nr:hypothetical protein BDR05DRAFT_1003322 [Suillus weaverae]
MDFVHGPFQGEIDYGQPEPEDAYHETNVALKDKIGIQDDGSDFGIELLDEIPATYTPTVKLGSPYYPWPSKAHFLTSLLFSSARLPFSDTQKKAALSWAKELGACDVPSLWSVKQSNNRISELVRNPMRKVTSASSNIFYINDIGHAIAKDYANPLTRFSMLDYPEDGGAGMSQVCNGQKMLLEMPSPPAARVGEKELYAMGRAVQYTDAGFIASDEQEVVPVSIFRRSFEDITDELACGVTPSSEKYLKLIPHPLREKAKGRMVYSVPLIIFMDDVSGNISKQWNKHHAIYMSNANLPREMLEKEFCVQFVTSSPHAAPMELMHSMQESISKAADSGIIAWDCKFDEEVMLVPQGLFLAGDNPMQAEECSHAGLNCNYFCRTCHVGGMKEYKESEAGYNSIFMEGNPRTPEDTMAQVCQQFDTALCSGAAGKIAAATTSTGIRDSASSSLINALVELGKKLRKREAGQLASAESEVHAALEKQLEDMLQGRTLQDAINPLLGMDYCIPYIGLNIHMDTPTEILHTVLLGIVKYFWGQTVFLLEKAKLLNLFQTRLDSLEQDGLNAPSLNAEYICHYKGGLIGKHFKSLAQIMPFVIYDLVPKSVLDGWTTIGELVVLIWHTKINDTESYLVSLTRTINDFLNVTAQCAPSILISKPKFHFLVHLPAYIHHFGPTIVFSTERYESFNHVFRLTCIYSNQRAPSRDTCATFTHNDTVKHIATGGYWYDTNVGGWVQGGTLVVAYLDDHPEQGRLLGIPRESLADPGAGKILAPKTSGHEFSPWEDTRCVEIFKRDSLQRPSHSHYYQGGSVVTSEHENVQLGRHIIFQDTVENKTRVGRIHEILISTATQHSVTFVALQIFSFMPARHHLLHLLCLCLENEERVVMGTVTLPFLVFILHELNTLQDIICAVNLQHNCLNTKCTHLSMKHLWQECIQTDRTTSIVEHQPSPEYLLNTFSIHNYQHIHSVLPEFLHETPLRVADPSTIRKTAVQQMQGKRLAKKSGGEVVNLPHDEDHSARPAFNHAKKQPKAKATSKKRRKSTSAEKQQQPVQAATWNGRAETTVPQPAVQSMLSTENNLQHHLPHPHYHPRMFAPPPIFASPPQMPPWMSQVPTFATSSSHGHYTSIIRSAPSIQVPTCDSLYHPAPETDSRQSGSRYHPYYHPP